VIRNAARGLSGVFFIDAIDLDLDGGTHRCAEQEQTEDAARIGLLLIAS
jgi:hypothetical protein